MRGGQCLKSTDFPLLLHSLSCVGSGRAGGMPPFKELHRHHFEKKSRLSDTITLCFNPARSSGCRTLIGDQGEEFSRWHCAPGGFASRGPARQPEISTASPRTCLTLHCCCSSSPGGGGFSPLHWDPDTATQERRLRAGSRPTQRHFAKQQGRVTALGIPSASLHWPLRFRPHPSGDTKPGCSDSHRKC